MSKLKIYCSTKGEYYAAEAPKDTADSHIPYPSKSLVETLSVTPGDAVLMSIVHEALAQEGNGEITEYTNTGVSP